MTDIVIDKNKLDQIVEKFKPELNSRMCDIFYLEETIPFKHLATGEEGTITNLPFLYDGNDYYIIYGMYDPDLENNRDTEWITHITHVNVCVNVRCKDFLFNHKVYSFYCHHFCNSLNYTLPTQHFGNEGLIKATLSYNIRQQNPSDAYTRADQWLKLFTKERALTCRQCSQAIKPDANPIERVLGVHLACRPNELHRLVIGENHNHINNNQNKVRSTNAVIFARAANQNRSQAIIIYFSNSFFS